MKDIFTIKQNTRMWPLDLILRSHKTANRKRKRPKNERTKKNGVRYLQILKKNFVNQFQIIC